MTESTDGPQWATLGLAGVLGLCCVGTAALAGGGLVAGGTAGATAASGAVDSIGGILVTGLATALPLVAIGLVLRRRARR